MSDEIVTCHFCGAENNKEWLSDDTIKCCNCFEEFFTGDNGFAVNEIECPYCGEMFYEEEYYHLEEEQENDIECPNCHKTMILIWHYGDPIFNSYRKED